ncbi:hypothetical protein Acr_07g0006220 [Actinidia rufa]|uniref:AAA-type ATPase N-terminal domain-containing protein n=1 Tax=Actinidia rufa TaxID=165716 RepID=A0A7J0EVE5_9ERIC|nr:hypothetical protein Acr_07g0006220 [Actinidia rufa]
MRLPRFGANTFTVEGGFNRPTWALSQSLQNILPSQILSLLQSFYESLQDLLSPDAYFDIPEFNGYCGVDVNHLYRHVNLYLNSTHPSAAVCRRLTLSRSPSSKTISFSLAPNHTVADSFAGHRLSWTHHVEAVPDSGDERRSFTLKLPKHHRLQILAPYLEHVTSRAEEFERVSRASGDCSPTPATVAALLSPDGPPDNVDPALVRCGRMDMHVSLGTCGPHAFRAVVKNYLGVETHALFDAVISVMQAKILGIDVDFCDKEVVKKTHECVDWRLAELPENWNTSPERGGGGTKRKEGSTWEKKVKFIVRLKSLTKSDSGRRGA